jgi:hypothetical protein
VTEIIGFVLCEIFGFCNDAVEILFLLCYGAMSLGDWYSKFQDHYAVLEMSGTNHTVTWHHTLEKQRPQPCVKFLEGLKHVGIM